MRPEPTRLLSRCRPIRWPARKKGKNTAVRDILTNIGQLTGINITYDRDAQTSAAYTIQVQDIPVEDALNQVLSANQLTFKVINPTTIFVYNDTPNKRQQWDDVYTQTFYVSHADVNEVLQLINQMITTGAVVRPAIAQNKGLNSIVVKATLPVLARLPPPLLKCIRTFETVRVGLSVAVSTISATPCGA